MIKLIENNNKLYAKIIRATYVPKSGEFYTDKDDELQFGFIDYKKDYKTGAHYHNHLDNETKQLDEILIFQQGSARIDFYSLEGSYIKSVEVNSGDTVLMYQGGHNILFYNDTRVLKIKTGAYDEKSSKTRIVGANNLELVIEN